MIGAEQVHFDDSDWGLQPLFPKADAAEAESSSAAELKALKSEIAKLKKAQKRKGKEQVSGLYPEVYLRESRDPTAVELMLRHRYGLVK